MSDQRLRPTGRPAPSVPVTRPTASRQVHQQPTQSFEREGERPQPQQPNFTMNHEPSGGGMVPPPPFSLEDEYELENGKRNKSKLWKKLAIGAGIAVVLLVIAFVVMKWGDSPMTTFDQNQITNGENTNPLAKTEGTASPLSSKEVSFDGNPVPVKWPSDVKPTRMELQLDPNTGQPVLLLVGDKEGLGTVIRSYNQTGDLSGYWVIVPDEESNTTNKTEETTESSAQ